MRGDLSPHYQRRAYGTEPQIWGGNSGCPHTWQARRYYREGGGGQRSTEAFSVAGLANADRIRSARWKEDAICTECGAWRGELGQEPMIADYLDHLTTVFAEVRRVLRDDGTLWLVLGDTYEQGDLRLVPARVALALQAVGWCLRADIIWAKPNPMPDGRAANRPTRAYEHVLLLATRLTRRSSYLFVSPSICGHGRHERQRDHDVWSIATRPGPEWHSAAFPPELVERCILAGSRLGDTVFDPFCGSGTTLAVAARLGRVGIGIELKPQYVELAQRRITTAAPLDAAIDA